MEAQQPSFFVVRTWGDVELVANGETPYPSSDAGRQPLPPQIPDTPRRLPAHAHTGHSQHTAADGVLTHSDGRRHTRPPNAAGSLCSRSPWRWRCSPPACVAPSSDASSSEHPSSLETGNTKTAIILLTLSLLDTVHLSEPIGWKQQSGSLVLTSPLGSCHHLLILHLVSQSFLHRFSRQVP